jgi:hypothetical protein
MAEDFENLLRDKMEQASLKELMPSFDVEEEWAGLQDRLQPSKRRSLIPVWAYAAAIILAIISGWPLLKNMMDNPQNEENKTATVSPKTKQPAVLQPMPVVTTKDSVKPQVAIAKANSGKRTTPNIQKRVYNVPADTTIVLVQQIPTTTQPAMQDSPQSIKHEPLQTVVAVKVNKQRPVALHVLDVENEDRDFMINKEYKGNPSGIIARIQNLLTTPETVVSSDKPYPAQILLKR